MECELNALGNQFDGVGTQLFRSGKKQGKSTFMTTSRIYSCHPPFQKLRQVRQREGKKWREETRKYNNATNNLKE